MKRPFIILSGPKFSGKSLLAEMLATRLADDGFAVSGSVQRGVFENGVKIGFDLIPARGGTPEPIIRRCPDGKWNFISAAFQKAELMIQDADVVILDEIGPLELSGSGHAGALKKALASSSAVIAVVRDTLAGDLMKFAAGRRAAIVNFTPGNSETAAEEIVNILKKDYVVKMEE